MFLLKEINVEINMWSCFKVVWQFYFILIQINIVEQ